MRDLDWQILYELKKTPNITQVANRLFFSQPSLTRRIQAMEEEFQLQILIRTRSGVEFTKEGLILADKAEEYLTFMESVRTALSRETAADNKVIIKIGSSYTYTKFVLSDILSEYQKEHSNVCFDIRSEQSNILFAKVCEGELDCAFVRDDYKGDVVQKKVESQRAYLLTKEPITKENLKKQVYIEYNINDQSKKILNQWQIDTFGEILPSRMNAGYVDVAWQLIAKGIGYTFCFLPEDYENAYQLHLEPLLDSNQKPVTRNTWFVYSRKKQCKPEIQEFINYIENNIVLKENM